MKIKCANCNEKTITLKQTFLSPKKMICPKCNVELIKVNSKLIYYSLSMLSLVLVLLITKFFIKIGISRYITIPLLPFLVIISLHISSYTKISSEDSEVKFNFKEFILTLIIGIPLIMLISTLLGF
jgi:hypothetical protein